MFWVIRQYSILINGKARPFQADQTRIPENSPDFRQMNVQSIHLEPGVLANAKFLYRLNDVHCKKSLIYLLQHKQHDIHIQQKMSFACHFFRQQDTSSLS